MEDGYFRVYKRQGRKNWSFHLWIHGERKDGYTEVPQRSGKRLAEAWVLGHLPEIQRHFDRSDRSLRALLDPFFTPDRCPHVIKLRLDRRPMGESHRLACRSRLEQYVFPDPIADMPIDDLRPSDIDLFKLRLLERCNPPTVNRVIGNLKTCFRYLIADRVIWANPFDTIGMIRHEEAQTPTLSNVEIRRLLLEPELYEMPDGYRGSKEGSTTLLTAHAFFALAALTGMRSGEIRALQWSQYNRSREVLRITHAMKGHGESRDLPKWNKIREIPLDPRVVTFLEALREDSLHVADTDYIFCYDTGRPIGRTWYVKRWQHIREKFERPTLLTKSLRHSFNTRLLEAGAPALLLQMYLGWAKTPILTGIAALNRVQEGYTHFSAESMVDLLPYIAGLG